MEKLTRDLKIDIISRLPIKSVVRCKSVSKSWESLLSDPSFAAAHFERASTLTPFSNYLVGKGEKHAYFIETEEEDNETSTISKPKHLTFPFLTHCLTRFSRPILMGSCLGYVCLSATDDSWPGAPTNPMYLFNPITGANILLPKFEETWSYSCVCGFGLDVSKQECKVVLVFLHEKTFSVQVHTVGRDSSWRTNTIPNMLTHVTGAELTNDRHMTNKPVGFNGSIHWIIMSSVDEDDMFGPSSACILSFQLDTEVFGVIPMPEPLQVMKPYFYNSMMYALQVCGRCLSIIYSPEAYFVDMWVMADYNISESWVKKYSIQLNCVWGSSIRPLGFRKNGELMLFLDHEGLVSYNTDSDRFKILRSCCTMPFPFVGSLISLKSAYGDSKVGVMATEALESSCDERIGLEANFEDMNSKGQLLASDTKPKLQFRKDISKAGWDVDLRMSEIIEKKGGMWTTMGIMRGSKLYCSIEETLFLAEIGALHLLDANDTTLSLKDIYEMVADRRNGCSWESFKAFRHLKSLGYIVGRHGVPWTLKNDKSCCKSTCPQETEESNIIPNSELQENVFINNHFRDMQISQLRPDFDVYLPNSKFKKSSPGNPDFVLCLARDPPSKAEIEGLERRCNGLPIKICNVEHGLVSFFSFNSVELPVLP